MRCKGFALQWGQFLGDAAFSLTVAFEEEVELLDNCSSLVAFAFVTPEIKEV